MLTLIIQELKILLNFSMFIKEIRKALLKKYIFGVLSSSENNIFIMQNKKIVYLYLMDIKYLC